MIKNTKEGKQKEFWRDGERLKKVEDQWHMKNRF